MPKKKFSPARKQKSPQEVVTEILKKPMTKVTQKKTLNFVTQDVFDKQQYIVTWYLNGLKQYEYFDNVESATIRKQQLQEMNTYKHSRDIHINAQVYKSTFRRVA